MNRNCTIQRPGIILFLMLFILAAFAGCSYQDTRMVKGDGNVVSSEHSVPYFNSIDIQGAFNVMLSQGSELMVSLETDENLQDYVEIEVTENKLHIFSERNRILNPTRIDLYITYPELRKLSIGGACKIASIGTIESDHLEFDLSGAADMNLDIIAESLRTIVSGAGNIHLSGRTTSHTVELSGASNLRAQNLITETTRISLSGAGTADVYASKFLDANLSGIGKIRYFGEPSETSISKSGLGSISPSK